METPAESSALAWRRGLPRKRMAAAVVLVDDDGQVLLVRPTYRRGWDLPGGVVEEDEAPYAAARRELREELGLDRVLGGLLAVDWVPPSAERTEGLIVVFDGGRLSADEAAGIRLPAEELAAWSFTPLDQLSELMTPLLARRVAASLTARAAGVTVYLQDGAPYLENGAPPV
ncbi:NUDIX hydrolase [Frankia sp. CNm7]|uniref:NUDIX hydrolase n=1 Tax=Frankia nepalensis TaxID=1836974 RepID=A0A937RV10_9ACTN|nr:NUDIX hydrolase [Frankia nepalensis]MBL7502183.1 NUDIX hydrolase [Frankia nepalensis]MBL7510551.1 NUDIX hydrolase [Frankia nepalensis]MBL7518277.1 NUDIX hydrolase [Frankia nepalensis]MBL7633338.1 NUDIX hydrolase [Frankia nepalensis]